MKKLCLFFEIDGMAQTEDGLPAPAGMQIDFGDLDKDFDYKEMTKDLNIPGILAYVGIDHIVPPESVRIITPEEYNTKFGEKEVS